MNKYTLLASCLVFIFFITSCGQKFRSAEYVTTTETVSVEQETQVSLDDGASISIPPNSIDGKASIKIERNPDKIKNLPALPDGFVQLSDFYNFEITGANLIGPVDITIPYNTSRLPDEEGIAFALFPTSDGWNYVPVELVDGKVTIYTHEIGDPLIAWRFSDITQGIPESEREKSKYICDPDIAVQAIDNGDGSFQILGLLQPPLAHKIYNDPLQFLRNPAAKLPVSIILNPRDEPAKNFQIFTDENGNFELTLNTTDGVREGWNWVLVKAKCDPWFLQVSVESRGYTEFRYAPIVQFPPNVATEAPTEVPVANPESIQPPRTPTEYVILPNVVGLPFDKAKGFLERIGYKVIWIDGKSTLELGQVYFQYPKAPALTVPHRTTVVLYRTTEKIEQPPECALLNLTPEECANAGTHNYDGSHWNLTFWDNTEYVHNPCREESSQFESELAISFFDGGVITEGIEGMYEFDPSTFSKIDTNKYEFSNLDWVGIITFERDGFELEWKSIRNGDKANPSCIWNNSYTLK